MFKLVKNEFLNNKCWYEDEYGNTVMMIRKESGFTAKIRFKDKTVKAKPFPVSVPSSNEDGANLQLEFPPGALEREDVKEGIEGFTELVQHWIDMLYDLKFLDCSMDLIKKNNPGCTEEDISTYKMERLAQNEELQPVISAIFSNSQNGISYLKSKCK